MPLPPPPAAGLTSSGKPTRLGRREQGLVGLVRVVVAGEDRDAERGCQPACGGLVAHRPDRRRRRPDPADPGGERPPRRSRRSRPGSRNPGGARPRRRPAQPPRRRRCRAGRAPSGPSVSGHDRADPEPVAGPRDPRRDLAAVGDEQGPDRRDGRRGSPSRRAIGGDRTRQSRQSRHATSPNAPGGQPAARDPALDGARGGPDPRRSLAWTQFLGHRVAIVAYRPTRRRQPSSDRAPRRVGASRRRRETPPAPPRSSAAGR